MNSNDIIASVKQGMIESAKVTHYMNYESGGTINTEYVATVSIGSALIKSNAFNHGDDKVIFEYSTKKFISSTVPFSKKENTGKFFPRTIVRKFSDTSRPGRIDIAVLGNNNGFDYPKCAIEVKGNNPSKSRFLEDIKRNIEYFLHTDKTGISCLKLSLNCSFESFNRKLDDRGKVRGTYAITHKDKIDYMKKIDALYQSYVSEATSGLPSSISKKIEVFSATETLVSPNATQEEFENIEDDIHLTLAVLVILER